MSNLSKKQRDALPASEFGDPANRLFPILDQDDVDSAARLIGKAKNPDAVKKRIIAIAKRKKLTIPAAWQEGTAKMAAFALDSARFDGEMVIRSGKIFEAGEYPDKDYAMTPEELWLAADQFQPVPIEIEHTPTVLDGKLGQLRAVEMDEDGVTLRGEVAIPAWLDQALGPGERQVSAVWNRETKLLEGLGLVRDGRIPDAALAAAFAKHATPQGQFALQEVHDVSARHGAVCQPGNTQAKMASRSEANTLQAVHDLTANNGAICSTVQRANSVTMPFGRKERRMGFKDTVKAWFNAGMPDDYEPPVTPPVTPSATPTQPAQPSAEVVALQAQVKDLREAKIAADAVAFAEGEIAARRAMPVEREAMITKFTQDATDDARNGLVTFSDGRQASRVDGLRALYAARPAHTLTQEMVKTGEGVAAFGNPPTTGERKTLTPAEVRALVEMTPLGRAQMKESN